MTRVLIAGLGDAGLLVMAAERALKGLGRESPSWL